MNRTEKIRFYQKQLKSSSQMKEVAMQNYNLAARLEAEAESALKVLGASKGQGRKPKSQLPKELELELISNLTKGHERNI